MEMQELLRLVNAASAGKRPYFFQDRDVDRLLSIVWAMAGELAVTRERLDTVERLLSRQSLISRADIDAYRPDHEAAEQRGQWHLDYIARLLRVLQQEVEEMQRGAAQPSAEDVSKQVARE